MRCNSAMVILSLLFALPTLPVVAGDGAHPIWEPTTISQPGKYVLTRDISSGNAAAVQIDADRVTLDLNGFTASHTGISGAAIQVNGNDVAVENGSVWSEYAGIALGGSNLTVQGVRITSRTGIIGSPGNTAIRANTISCTAQYTGIDLTCSGCRISGNVIRGCGEGIRLASTGEGNQVLDNTISEVSGYLLNIESSHNHIEGNLLTGDGVWSVGLVFNTGSSDNVYRRNVARGNYDGFNDHGTNNTSHGDNYMPNQM